MTTVRSLCTRPSSPPSGRPLFANVDGLRCHFLTVRITGRISTIARRRHLWATLFRLSALAFALLLLAIVLDERIELVDLAALSGEAGNPLLRLLAEVLGVFEEAVPLATFHFEDEPGNRGVGDSREG